MDFQKGVSFFLAFLLWGNIVQANQNYKDALAKSILFFQGQRSGRFPTSNGIPWRAISGLSDGSLAHVWLLLFLLPILILLLVLLLKLL